MCQSSIEISKQHDIKLIMENVPRLCSMKNWREPNTLNLWNPVSPAYDFYEKAKIF